MTSTENPKSPPGGDNPKAEEDQLRQLVAAGEGPVSSHFGARLRGYFLTGLIVVGPVAITIYVVWWFITLVDGWVKPLIPQSYLPETYLPFPVPGVGLIFGILGVMLIGALTANLFGRTIVSYGEMMLDRMPVIRGVYRLLKQIFETVFSKTGYSFKRVGLIEFPRRGLYALVFVSGDPPRRGEAEGRQRRSADDRVHAECAQSHHRLRDVHAGEGRHAARYEHRGRGQDGRVRGSRCPGSGRAARSSPKARRRRSRCPRKSPSSSNWPLFRHARNLIR